MFQYSSLQPSFRCQVHKRSLSAPDNSTDPDGRFSHIAPRILHIECRSPCTPGFSYERTNTHTLKLNAIDWIGTYQCCTPIAYRYTCPEGRIRQYSQPEYSDQSKRNPDSRASMRQSLPSYSFPIIRDCVRLQIPPRTLVKAR